MYEIMTRPKRFFLDNILLWSFLPYGHYRRGTEPPGNVIKRLSPEARKLLQELKSEDLANIRVDAWF